MTTGGQQQVFVVLAIEAVEEGVEEDDERDKQSKSVLLTAVSSSLLTA